ncbi:MAG TPA: hypothetical protein EYP31_04235 [Roseibacterium sp.]|nr:hypothetical protein [Roseibacterium sp.]
MSLSWLMYSPAAFAVVALSLAIWRQIDRSADQSAWLALIELQNKKPTEFDISMIAGLPEAAQRYFRFTIEPGAPLCTAVEIEMTGKLGLGTKEEPNYRPMRARQILSPPYGLVWRLDAGAISGSDGALPDRSWTRFWLFHVIPVVRVSNQDHRRSAFGRVVAEATFWAPASLLPSAFVRWEDAGDDIARAIVTYGGFTQSVDIRLSETGAPTHVTIQRWSNKNPTKTFREQPFGGELSKFRNFDGYRLPTHVEGGNHIGTPEYFPFFKADVTRLRCRSQTAS